MSKSSKSLVPIRGTLRMPSTEEDHPIVCWVDAENNSLQVCWPDGRQVSGSVLMIASITLGANWACPVPRPEVIAALTTIGCTVTEEAVGTDKTQ